MWIRRFQPADAGPCAQVFHRAIHEGAAAHYSPEQRTAWAGQEDRTQGFAAKLSVSHCFVADNGAVQGFMSLDEAKGYGYVDMAYVAPEFRGTGLAAQLYAAILNVAHGLAMTRLQTHASFLARPFFQRQGWEVKAFEEVERGGEMLGRYEMFVEL
ncbi:MAG: GNAT family N-acetyltransferase [Pseudomonadota bacterium]